ncbi:unnamed protein product, partial [Mesorhabditis belari]|uniref:Uncharacterized protein n=1 Tax=Mesorhabditis belari TaxID=2138241 RepID=A0AAF3J4Z1_9BILA
MLALLVLFQLSVAYNSENHGHHHDESTNTTTPRLRVKRSGSKPCHTWIPGCLQAMCNECCNSKCSGSDCLGVACHICCA